MEKNSIRVANASIWADPASNEDIFIAVDKFIENGGNIDNLVIWTKHPRLALELNEETIVKLVRAGTNIFMQVTINPHINKNTIEKGIPSTADVINFLRYMKISKMSNVKIPPDRIRWRLSPIDNKISTDGLDIISKTAATLSSLCGITECIIDVNKDTYTPADVDMACHVAAILKAKNIQPLGCSRLLAVRDQCVLPANCAFWINKHTVYKISPDFQSDGLACYDYSWDFGSGKRSNFGCTYCYTKQ